MSFEVRNSGITATRAVKSLAIKSLPIREKVLHTIRIWQLFVMLSQRHDSKGKQSIMFFLNKRLRKTDYLEEDQLSALLETIITKFNVIVGTGLFKFDGGKVVRSKKNIRMAMKNGDLIRLHQSHFYNPDLDRKGSRTQRRLDGDVFFYQLIRAVTVVAPLVQDNSYVLTLDGVNDQFAVPQFRISSRQVLFLGS
jgi:hypothetical protein